MGYDIVSLNSGTPGASLVRPPATLRRGMIEPLRRAAVDIQEEADEQATALPG